MSSMVEVNSQVLTGKALDWAVAQAEGITQFVMGNDWPGNSVVDEATEIDRVVICNLLGRLVVTRGSWSGEWNPSTNWSQGGPMIDKYAVQLQLTSGGWHAQTDLRQGTSYYAEAFCSCPLIAMCRAIVIAKLGQKVLIPAILLAQDCELSVGK